MENFIVNKGYSINLIVKEDDTKLINISNEFIIELEKEYFKYKNKLEKEIQEFAKYKNKHVYFSQEKLLKKSPLTIINAPWGSGKTYFIEQLAKNFIDQKINIKGFKNIIILDIFKFSNSKNIPDEIMAELFFILAKIYDQDNKNDLLNKLHKFAIKFFNATVIAWINYFGKFNFEKFKIKDLNETEEMINEISKSLEPTLIIFDNIERIGKNSWEILKAIFKISQIDNFCFILPMNINKLNGNDNNKKNDEYPIEKYIDLPIFEFKQDYLAFLKNNGISEQEAIIINNILNTEIDGEKLSIREVEQRFNKNDIFKENNKYLRIDKIVKNVWGSVSEAKKYLNDEIKDYLEKLNQLEFSFKQIKGQFKQINYQKINLNQSTKDNIAKICNNSWNFNHNYEEWINTFDNILKDFKIYINNNQIKNIELIATKEKLNLNFPIVDNNIRNLNLRLEEELNLKSKDDLKINQIQIEIGKQINNLSIIKNQINLIKQKIYNIEEEYRNLDYKNLEESIKDYREKVNNINQSTDLYLINKYYMWDRKFDYARDNSNYVDYFIDCLFS